MPEITKNADLQKALLGRTIVAAAMDDQDGLQIDGTWEDYEIYDYKGGNLRLTFDDGSVLTTACEGYDAWSNTVEVTPPRVGQGAPVRLPAMAAILVASTRVRAGDWIQAHVLAELLNELANMGWYLRRVDQEGDR